MIIEFKVHTMAMTKTNARTTVDGEDLQAQVDCLEVELTTVKARHGTMTLRFIGSEIEEAKAIYKQDASISVDFKAPAAKKPPALPND